MQVAQPLIRKQSSKLDFKKYELQENRLEKARKQRKLKRLPEILNAKERILKATTKDEHDKHHEW